MIGSSTPALFNALGHWAQDVGFPALVELRGWEVFEMRDEDDPRKPMHWTTASIRASGDHDALNQPEKYLRVIAGRADRRGGRELAPRVMALYVIQGDDSIWIDEQGDLYDRSEDSKRFVKLPKEWIVTAAYIDGNQVYETTIEADSQEEAEVKVQQQCKQDNGLDGGDDDLLTDVFARIK